MNKIIKRADFVTLANIAAGLASILFSVRHMFDYAAIALVCAVAFDALDGKVARWLGESNKMGRELDSLCDVVSFGAAPAVFSYVVWISYDGRANSILAAIAGIVLLCCGALRLARFNITHLPDMFEGMPITVNGVIFPVLWFIDAAPWAFVVAMLVSSALMVSSIRIPKLF
jgi:CDP-diacylglycerol--serine O-phosphatidyltransferase